MGKPKAQPAGGRLDRHRNGPYVKPLHDVLPKLGDGTLYRHGMDVVHRKDPRTPRQVGKIAWCHLHPDDDDRWTAVVTWPRDATGTPVQVGPIDLTDLEAAP